MIVFAKSKNGKMIKIGSNANDAKWYFMTDEVIKNPIVGKINVNDNVAIQSKTEAGSLFVTDIKPSASTSTLVDKVPAPIITGAGEGNEVKVTEQKEPYLPKDEWVAQQKAKGLWKEGGVDKGSDTNNSIKKQAIMHATSRTLINRAKDMPYQELEAEIRSLYALYTELVA